jgi:hypothetical protein
VMLRRHIVRIPEAVSVLLEEMEEGCILRLLRRSAVPATASVAATFSAKEQGGDGDNFRNKTLTTILINFVSFLFRCKRRLRNGKEQGQQEMGDSFSLSLSQTLECTAPLLSITF